MHLIVIPPAYHYLNVPQVNSIKNSKINEPNFFLFRYSSIPFVQVSKLVLLFIKYAFSSSNTDILYIL